MADEEKEVEGAEDMPTEEQVPEGMDTAAEEETPAEPSA